MADFTKAIQRTLQKEGGYVNDTNDTGGETYKGISRNNWPGWDGWFIVDMLKRDNNFLDSLEKNSELQNEVKRFYLINFWEKIAGDKITSDLIAETLFDFAVNAGLKTAIKLAQEVVEVNADGIMGKMTLSELNYQDPESFVKFYTLKKIERYIEICDKNPVQKKYFFGWVKRACDM